MAYISQSSLSVGYRLTIAAICKVLRQRRQCSNILWRESELGGRVQLRRAWLLVEPLHGLRT